MSAQRKKLQSLFAHSLNRLHSCDSRCTKSNLFHHVLGVIIFGSDQEVGELMLAVRRRNATGWFSWIGSDGWGGRGLAYEGKEAQVRINMSLRQMIIFNMSEHDKTYKITCASHEE